MSATGKTAPCYHPDDVLQFDYLKKCWSCNVCGDELRDDRDDAGWDEVHANERLGIEALGYPR